MRDYECHPYRDADKTLVTDVLLGVLYLTDNTSIHARMLMRVVCVGTWMGQS